jgi:hypothetical protein
MSFSDRAISPEQVAAYWASAERRWQERGDRKCCEVLVQDLTQFCDFLDEMEPSA